MSRILLGVTFIVFTIAIGIAFFTLPNHPSPGTSVASKASAATSTPGAAIAARGHTLAEVAAHRTASNCWTAINGSVYNLTGWISRHPGGPAPILSLCGTDGSAAFNRQHGTQARPATELKNFLIGPLAK